jgi:hypothetical protein
MPARRNAGIPEYRNADTAAAGGIPECRNADTAPEKEK